MLPCPNEGSSVGFGLDPTIIITIVVAVAAAVVVAAVVVVHSCTYHIYQSYTL